MTIDVPTEAPEVTDTGTSTDAPEAAVVDYEAENVELRAALNAYGVTDVDTFLTETVTYRRDGTVVVNLPTPVEPAEAEAPVSAPKRAPRPRPASTAQPVGVGGVRVNPNIPTAPADGLVNTQTAYDLAKAMKTQTPDERAALLGGVKVTA